MRLSHPLLLGFGWLLLWLSPAATAQPEGGLLQNGGFEGGSGSNGKGAGVPRWDAFETGYDIDRQTFHGGEQSIRCDSLRTNTLLGAMMRLEIAQKRPIPILVSGWSKADKVGGVRDGDYSLYIDLEYTDGTPFWGQIAPFNVGTHDWQRRQVLVLPAKPIKTMTVYALFRHHTGTAWFDDFAAYELAGAKIFDSQPLAPQFPRRTGRPGVRVTGKDGLALDFDAGGGITRVRTGGKDVTATTGGFFVRDVAANGPLVALRGIAKPNGKGGVQIDGVSEETKIRFRFKVEPKDDALSVDGDLTDLTRTDRAITVYLALPVKADGWQWGQDIRHAETIEPGREYTNQTRINVGTTGGLSLYPFGSISTSDTGLGIASQMDWPSVYRIFYNGAARQFAIAWDFALTGLTRSWPAHNARFRCSLFCLPPDTAAWGFRAAAQRFYRLNAADFDRRAKAEGIWMPFTDPVTVQNFQDFGFAYHEGDNSLKSDDAHGILSFRYTEPMTYWMPMPPEMPRTYEAALTLLHKNAGVQGKTEGEKGRKGEGENPNAQHPTPNTPSREARDFARAVLNSGTFDESGRFNVEFQNQPWANGAVFVLNPNPELPASEEKPTKAFLSYTVEKATATYSAAAKQTKGEQDGEYLDSLEGWADYQDYRPSNIATSPYPIPFELDSRRPVLPQWYSTHSLARFMRDDLHNRGKLLMANTTPVRFSIYSALMDVMGIEVNWLDGEGKWQPDSDEVFNLRRTMSYRKPYLLLMNTNYDKFTSPMVEKYMQRSLFYGVFPSMFSADAATHPYWDSPQWYNRDRALFKKYIPVVKRLSAAGWEPLTHARSSEPAVYVERFGTRLLTVLNDSRQPHNATLTVDLRALGLQTATLHVFNILSGAEVPAQRNGATLSVSLHLNPDEAQGLELR